MESFFGSRILNGKENKDAGIICFEVRIETGKNTKSLFFLLGLKYILSLVHMKTLYGH